MLFSSFSCSAFASQETDIKELKFLLIGPTLLSYVESKVNKSSSELKEMWKSGKEKFLLSENKNDSVFVKFPKRIFFEIKRGLCALKILMPSIFAVVAGGIICIKYW